MLEIISAEYAGGYRLRVCFSNGDEGTVDLTDSLWGLVFEPLRDPAAFERFEVSPVLHTARWENPGTSARHVARWAVGSSAWLFGREPWHVACTTANESNADLLALVQKSAAAVCGRKRKAQTSGCRRAGASSVASGDVFPCLGNYLGSNSRISK
jgi:hypothetical protein